MNLDGLSLSAMAAELRQSFLGGRITRIFQPSKQRLILWIRQPNHDQCLSISIDPSCAGVFSCVNPPENPVEASSFSMLLRKNLADGRIVDIQQQGLDRIITIDIARRGDQGMIETLSLHCELMGRHSNIVLVGDGIIIDSVKKVGSSMSRVRQILPGRPYQMPPAPTRADFFTISAETLSEKLLQNTAPLSKSLLTIVEGLGPLTIAEWIFRTGLTPAIRGSELDHKQLQALFAASRSIIEPFQAGEFQPVVATDKNENILGIAAFPLFHLESATTHSFPTLSQAFEFAESLIVHRVIPGHELLSKIVAGELSRLRRKSVLLEEELAKAQDADAIRNKADLIMAHLQTIPHGQSKVSLADVFAITDTDQTIEVELNPAMSAANNAQKYYKSYAKAKRAQNLIKTQITQCLEDIDYFEGVALHAAEAVTNLDITEIMLELADQGLIKKAGKARPPANSSRPYAATTESGSTIWVGRNNRQNDLITMKQAKPTDYWFHTQKIPGAHVILKCDKAGPDNADIMSAAHLAAWFSKSRDSSNVPVDYTQRRYVQKPSGAKPGFVIYTHQNTVYITPDAQIIKKLLNS